MKTMISKLEEIIKNEMFAGIYAVLAVLIMMFVATSDNLLLIGIAFANLLVAVKWLNVFEDKVS